MRHIQGKTSSRMLLITFLVVGSILLVFFATLRGQAVAIAGMALMLIVSTIRNTAKLYRGEPVR